jgi:hypothetical protein
MGGVKSIQKHEEELKKMRKEMDSNLVDNDDTFILADKFVDMLTDIDNLFGLSPSDLLGKSKVDSKDINSNLNSLDTAIKNIGQTQNPMNNDSLKEPLKKGANIVAENPELMMLI